MLAQEKIIFKNYLLVTLEYGFSPNVHFALTTFVKMWDYWNEMVFPPFRNGSVVKAEVQVNCLREECCQALPLSV